MHARLIDYFICFYFVKIHIYFKTDFIYLGDILCYFKFKSVAKHKYI